MSTLATTSASSTISWNASSALSWNASSAMSWNASSESNGAKHSHADKVIEIFYLSLVAVVGSFGNLIVIFSIMLEKRVHLHGNIFVISLAAADLLVTGFVVPTVIANVVYGDCALSSTVCTVVGYIVTVTCTCSLNNLALIAVNRYWAMVRNKTYIPYLTKRRIYLMMIGVWVWSNLLSLPTLTGWSRIDYDSKMMVCSWDDDYQYGFTIFLTNGAIFVPLTIISLCYSKLYIMVRKSGKWVRSVTISSGIYHNSHQIQRSLRRERDLLRTLATTVVFFCICWLPYGFAILSDRNSTLAPLPKKVFGWLGLSNSAVNFIIYGTTNQVFRRGYRNLFRLIFKCKKFEKATLGSFYKNAIDNTPQRYRCQTPTLARTYRQTTSNRLDDVIQDSPSLRVEKAIFCSRNPSNNLSEILTQQEVKEKIQLNTEPTKPVFLPDETPQQDAESDCVTMTSSIVLKDTPKISRNNAEANGVDDGSGDSNSYCHDNGNSGDDATSRVSLQLNSNFSSNLKTLDNRTCFMIKTGVSQSLNDSTGDFAYISSVLDKIAFELSDMYCPSDDFNESQSNGDV